MTHLPILPIFSGLEPSLQISKRPGVGNPLHRAAMPRQKKDDAETGAVQKRLGDRRNAYFLEMVPSGATACGAFAEWEA